MRFGAILARSAEVSFSCKQIWRMVGEVSPVVQSTFTHSYHGLWLGYSKHVNGLIAAVSGAVYADVRAYY